MEHINADALRALVGASSAQKQQLALHSGIAPSTLTNLLIGRRLGTDPDLRLRLAAALTAAIGIEVTATAITCHCPTSDQHQVVR